MVISACSISADSLTICTQLSCLFALQNGLAPTHQLIKQAREAGFTNVHDFLVHQSTGKPRVVYGLSTIKHANTGLWT